MIMETRLMREAPTAATQTQINPPWASLGSAVRLSQRNNKPATVPKQAAHKSRLKCRPGQKLKAVCIMTESKAGGTSVESTSLPRIRRLILLRHAKSSWADRALKDHDRPLNERGRISAASLASKLQQVGWLPELILCSDSARTRETLDIMQEHVPQLMEAEVHFLGSYYSVAAMDGQTAQHLQETICKYSRDDTLTIMCMGHNRGWEEAASIFSGTPIELKTANAALLEAPGSSWQEAFQLAGLGGWNLLGIVKADKHNQELV